MKRILYAGVFAVVLGIFYFAEPWFDLGSEAVLLTLLFITPLIIIISGVMGLRYGRTGVSYFLILIGCMYALYLLPGGMPRNVLMVRRIRESILLILPVLMVYYALSPDKGFWSKSGILGLVFLVLGAGFVAGTAVLPQFWQPLGVLSAWEPGFIPEGVRSGFRSFNIPPLHGIGLGLGFILLLGITIFRRRDPLWLAPWPYILLAFVGGISRMDRTGLLLYWLNAGLLLILSILIHEGWVFAFVDSLTRVHNRRALEQRLDRLRGSYTIAMVDIDHFKSFNDTFGHDIGDQVLRKVAGQLSKKGISGKVYRYGGEEFTIILPRISGDQVKIELELLRKRIGTTPFIVRKGRKRVTITVSIGAKKSSGKGKNPWEILKEADSALYKAKKLGRNRVCFDQT